MTVAPLAGQAATAVRHSTARFNIYDGAVRSAKTVASLVAWLMFVRLGPPGPLLMVGRTERTLRRNVIDVLVEWLGPKRARLVAGSGELWLLGRKVYLVGANDETAQERIRGLSLVGAYVDEASTLPESFWAMLSTRLSVPGARLFATTNPDGPRHWLKVKYLDRAALVVRDARTHLDRRHEIPAETDGDDDAVDNADVLDLHRFRFRLTDNPHLPRGYVRNLRAEHTGLWRARLIDGEWALASGTVYDMFDERRHVVDDVPDLTTVLAAGVDYGSTNPTAALMLGLTRDGRLAITREWRHDPSRAGNRALTVAEVSRDLRAWIGDQAPRFVTVDPAAAPLKVQLHTDGLRGVVDADNAVLDGIRLVGSMLATGRLVIHRSCTGLLDELPGYAWDDKAAERGEDRPVKANDHAVDALRYAVQTTEALWRPHLRPADFALAA